MQTEDKRGTTEIHATFTWEFGGYESEWVGDEVELARIYREGMVEEHERLTSITIWPHTVTEDERDAPAWLASPGGERNASE